MAKGIERIKELIKNTKIKDIDDEQTIKVAEYLITREDMDEKYLNETKDLKGMYKYIISRADKARKSRVLFVDDNTVYGWAIQYWNESEEDLKKENETNDKLSKKEIKSTKKESSNEIDAEKNVSGQKIEQKNGQKDTDIVFKYKGKDVTRAQFESKEFLTW